MKSILLIGQCLTLHWHLIVTECMGHSFCNNISSLLISVPFSFTAQAEDSITPFKGNYCKCVLGSAPFQILSCLKTQFIGKPLHLENLLFTFSSPQLFPSIWMHPIFKLCRLFVLRVWQYSNRNPYVENDFLFHHRMHSFLIKVSLTSSKSMYYRSRKWVYYQDWKTKKSRQLKIFKKLPKVKRQRGQGRTINCSYLMFPPLWNEVNKYPLPRREVRSFINKAYQWQTFTFMNP